MPRFKIEIASTRVYMADITIAADTQEEAEDLALEIACGEVDHPEKPEGWEPQWDYHDGMGVEVIRAEEVKDTD